jgi:hypothetical protein
MVVSLAPGGCSDDGMLSRSMSLSLWVEGAVSDAFLFLFRFRELVLGATGAGLGLVTAADPPVIHDRVTPPRKVLRVALDEAI